MINALLTKASPHIGILCTLTLFYVGPVQAADFHYNGTTHSIEMEGKIRAGDELKFSSLLTSHPEAKSVDLLGSVGGEYMSSLEMSLEVKKRGLNTVSASYCHSGCAYIWLAGATRKVVGAAPEIHLPYANATGEAFPKLTYAWLAALGLSRTFADAVIQGVGPNNSFVKLTPEFLRKFGTSKGQDV